MIPIKAKKQQENLFSELCSSGKMLMRQLRSSAYIGVDSLVSTNPWEFGGKIDELVIANAVSLINNFTEAGFENMKCGTRLSGERKSHFGMAIFFRKNTRQSLQRQLRNGMTT